MKTIGFVDYYLSEWHANNYPIWIREICERTGKQFCVKYAWAERDISPVDGRSTDEWCKAFGVEKCDTIEELCEKSDYILVLAPSNPETHLRLAEKVLPFGKRTYIDKTFAPDCATAQKIFAIAQKYSTPFFSSSALRFGTELGDVKSPVTVAVKGGGGNLPEYIVHQAEMVVKTLGLGVKSVVAEKLGDNHYLMKIGYGDERSATMEYRPDYGFEIAWKQANGEGGTRAIVSDMFVYLLESILRFYEDGKLPIDSAQTLEVMKIREAAVRSVERLGENISL